VVEGPKSSHDSDDTNGNDDDGSDNTNDIDNDGDGGNGDGGGNNGDDWWPYNNVKQCGLILTRRNRTVAPLVNCPLFSSKVVCTPRLLPGVDVGGGGGGGAGLARDAVQGMFVKINILYKYMYSIYESYMYMGGGGCEDLVRTEGVVMILYGH
jgi:hypothetical protein